MFGFLKRRRLPAGHAPALAADERIVAWAGATGDDIVVVTTFGLWLPGTEKRLGWHEIHKATWSGRQLALIAAREVPGDATEYTVVEDLPPLIITLLDPDRVPEQVRTRINRSVAYSSHHPVPGSRGGVRVVGRRVSGVNGLRWTVRYDEGVDPSAPGMAQQTEELVAWAKSGAGVAA